MQTVNFQCGHCGNLMAVSSQFLGQQVRCPHCQQVVVAPAPAAPAPAPAAPAGAPAAPPLGPSILEDQPLRPNTPDDDQESIFGPPSDDDLFGRAAARPTVDMPEPPPPPLFQQTVFQVPAPLPESPPLPEPSPAPGPALLEPTAELPPPNSFGGSTAFYETQQQGNGPPEDGAAQAPTETAWTAPSGSELESPEPLVDSPGSSISSPRMHARKPGVGANLAMLALIVLVPYAIVMTIIAVVLYLRPPPPHPFEMMPESPDAVNPGGKRQQQQSYSRFPPDGKGSELPPQLHVALGHAIQIGDLEVIPRQVVLGDIKVHVGNFNPEFERTLLLKLHLKNTSKDVSFHPTDPLFERAWKEGDVPTQKPYTYLVMGNKKLFGGPVKLQQAHPARHRDDEPPVYVEGQHHDKELKPGEEMDTIICLDPKDDPAAALAEYRGPMTWCVQLRRGLVQWKDRDVSTTAIIGVDFTDADIVREPSKAPPPAEPQ